MSPTRRSLATSFSPVVVWSVHLVPVLGSLALVAGVAGSTLIVDGSWSIEPWRETLADLPRWAELLAASGHAVGVALLVALGAGTLIAVLVFKTKLPCRSVAAALLVLGAVLPLYVTNAAAVGFLGLERLEGCAWGVGLVHGLGHVPLVSLLVGLGLRSVDRDLEEAALLEGRSSLGVLARVSIPAAAPALVVAGAFVAVSALGDYSVSDVLLVRTFAEEAYTQIALRAQPAHAVITGLPAMMMGVMLLLVAAKWLRGVGGRPPASARPWLLAPAHGRVALGVGALLVCSAFLLVPLARNGAELGERGLIGHAALFVPELATSVWTSAAAGFACALLAPGLAWAAVRRPRARLLLAAWAVVLLATPPALLGLGLISVFNRPGIAGLVYDSPGLLAIAYIVRFLPIAFLLLLCGMRSLDVDLERAAEVDGCRGDFSVLWRIVHPSVLPWTVAAGLVVTVLSLGELPCSLLVTPPGYVTLGARFFSLIHYGLTSGAAALCLLQFGAAALPAVGLLVLARRWLRP